MRVAVVGTFDGVHCGHTYLLSELKTVAAKQGCEPLALTFNRHPLSLIAPQSVPLELSSIDERRSLIEQMGIAVEVLEFDAILKQMTAVEFLQMVRERFGVVSFLLGFNNRIGSDRIGIDSPTLGDIAMQSGVEIVAATANPDIEVSSSMIRREILSGNVEKAAELLGRPYSVEGEVVHGRQLGRTIGFPTANVNVAAQRALPDVGVYVAETSLGNRAVVNIGRRPTVEKRNDAPLSVEAHIIGFTGNLYGKHLKLEFLRRLRGEQRFPSLDALKAAIAADVAAAMNIKL